MNDALPHCHQKPMYKQTVPCQGYAQSVCTDAGGVKCLLMFIWRKLTCCSLTDPLPLRVSLWSTIKRCTLAAEVTESRWRSLWTRAAEAHRGLTDPTSGRFVTPLKTLSTGMETCSKSGPRASWNVAVRTCRATVPALAGQRAERQRYWDQVPLLLPPSQIRFFGAASTESNRSRGRYRCGEERVTVAKRGLRWPTGRRIAPTRERKGTKSIVIPSCLISSHGSGKIRATNWLKASPKKIMLIPAWPACHSKWSQNSNWDRDHRRHRSTSACASFLGAEAEVWNFVMASHPGQKKSVIMTSFFDGIVQIGKKSFGRIWPTSSIIEAPRRGAMRGMSL